MCRIELVFEINDLISDVKQVVDILTRTHTEYRLLLTPGRSYTYNVGISTFQYHISQ